jgi:L,D-transpeptidase YcbB
MVSVVRWLFTFLACPAMLYAQMDKEKIKGLVTSGTVAGINEDIGRFYEMRDYAPAWFAAGSGSACDSLFSLLQTATQNALNEEDYEPQFVHSVCEKRIQPENDDDSVALEIKITVIALRFIRDITYGNIKPVFGYDGLKYSPGCFDIPGLLNNCLRQNTWNAVVNNSNSVVPEIKVLTREIELLQIRKSQTDFNDEIITSSIVNANNRTLCKKLFYLGITESIVQKAPDSVLKKSLMDAQLKFGLLADGVLRSTILRELNTPVSARLTQLYLSLNYYRWLGCLSQGQPVIVVNIPAAYLKVYHRGGTIIEMKMVVGKPTTPTPTLTSRVNEVILYPYWTVPRSIATKELLPAIKRNPGYLAANNFRLITSNGKIVDPYQVDWKEVNSSNFSYTIRQSTGCDNSLGLIKLNFYSPYGVYLHDTPSKNFFTFNKRYFSHGCMRMEKPMELGHLVLKNNAIAIDTLEEKGCLRHQSPITVPADEKMAVVVWYNPVGINDAGRLTYYEDVYKRLIRK